MTSYIPHVMLLFWIHDSSEEHRRNAFNVFQLAITDTYHPGFEASVTADGLTSRRAIRQSFLRDMKNGGILDGDLQSLLRGFTKVHQQFVMGPEESQLVSWYLAATRRQLCLGEGDADQTSLTVSLVHKFIAWVVIVL